MQLNFLALSLGLASLAYSQSLTGLPDCAKSCVTEFTSGSNIGGCPSLDVACICASQDFLSGIACCLAGACDAADQATSVAFAQSLCKSAGVTNLPAAVSCTSSSGTATATATSGTSATAPAATANSTGTVTGTSATATTSSNVSAKTSGTSSAASSATASATSNVGAQNLANLGAGLLGLAAVVLV